MIPASHSLRRALLLPRVPLSPRQENVEESSLWATAGGEGGLKCRPETIFMQARDGAEDAPRCLYLRVQAAGQWHRAQQYPRCGTPSPRPPLLYACSPVFSMLLVAPRCCRLFPLPRARRAAERCVQHACCSTLHAAARPAAARPAEHAPCFCQICAGDSRGACAPARMCVCTVLTSAYSPDAGRI